MKHFRMEKAQTSSVCLTCQHWQSITYTFQIDDHIGRVLQFEISPTRHTLGQKNRFWALPFRDPQRLSDVSVLRIENKSLKNINLPAIWIDEHLIWVFAPICVFHFFFLQKSCPTNTFCKQFWPSRYLDWWALCCPKEFERQEPAMAEPAGLGGWLET